MDKFPTDYFYLVSFKRSSDGIEDEIVGYAPYLPSIGAGFLIICKGKEEGVINVIKTIPVEDVMTHIDKPNYRFFTTEAANYDLWVLEEKVPALEVEEFIKDELIDHSPEVDMIMDYLDCIEELDDRHIN